jgi:hypothetical protein
VRVDATILAASVLADLKELFAGFPGESPVVIELQTSIGRRRLKLGADFRVARSAGLHAELDALLGAALLADEATPPAEESAPVAVSA